MENKKDQEAKPYNRKSAIDAAMANAPAENKGIGGHVRDLALSGLSSAIAVPELAVGLADIPTGGRVGKFLENEDGSFGFRPREAKEAIAGWKTERSQEQMQEFTDTEGFGAKLNYARKNPSLITNTVTESLAPMLAGGVIGRGLGLAAKGLSPVAAGALGEGAVGAGLAAESIRQQTDDGLLTGKQAGLAAATGATTAGFGFAGGRLAKELGIADFDTSLVSGNLAGRTAAEIAEGAAKKQPGFIKRVAGGAFSEGLLEELPQSVSETILQNEALGKPLDEGVSDAAALGLLSGAAMGGFAGGITRNRQPVSDDITPTEDMGQEAPRLGLPNPNAPNGNQLGYQGALSDPNNPNWIENANPDYFNRGQGPDASLMRNLNPDPELPFNSELGGQFSAAPDGTVFTEAEYNDFLAQQQAQARSDRDAGMPDVNDITPVPQGYEQSGSDPRLPAPRSDFEVTPDGTVQTAADVNINIQNERAANAERLASRLRGDIQDNTPVPSEASGFGNLEPVDNRTPSQKMGLDPNAGALSAAAVIAVDSGASSVADQTNAPTQSAWQQSMNERLQMADETSAEYQSLAQAMANEPTSVPAKNKMLRDAAKLPSKQVDSKAVDPKARVIDESRAQTKAYTPKGDEVQAQWDVVDASQLITSNTDSFTPNPNFPAERQPRDRTRAGSQKQVNDIANKLQPNMLGESSDISTGSPFIGANDNVVDSGNGRTMAIRRAYQEGSEKSKEYRQFVSESAGKYGLDVNAVNNMQAPVLVRRNMSNMDRNQFASEANQTAVARMSSTEQAATDAKKLPDASLLSFGSDGAMNLYQSSGYIKNFISGLPNTEQASMMDDNGALSQEGKRRVEAAIIQDAYDAPNLVTAISETLGEGSKNILKVVTDKAPQISKINNYAKTGDGYASTLSRDIADAAQAYMDITKSGEDVESYLSKGALFDDGLSDDARDILKSFYDNRRSAKAMGENIQERINAVTGKGNPKQGGLSFDDDAPTTTSQEVTTNDNPDTITRERNKATDNTGTPRTETGVSDRNASQDAVARQTQTGVGLDSPSVDQEIDARKSYAQTQTEVADEMGITTNEDGEYDISDAQFDVMEGRVRERMEAQDNQDQPQSNVAESETVSASPIKPTRSSVVKSETAPESKKTIPKSESKSESMSTSVDGRLIATSSTKAAMKNFVEIKENVAKEMGFKPDERGNYQLTEKQSNDMYNRIDDIQREQQGLPKRDKPKFSRANTKGSTNTTRQQVINKLSDKFGKETIKNLIADGKLDIKMLSDFVKNGRLTIPSDVDGLYLNGKATLIADNLSDEMIIPTFLHELGGHGGMQTLMDKKAYNALMKDFDALVKAGDPLAVHAKTIADKVARNKQEALDEYLPYLLTLASRQQVRQGKIAGMINRMVMAVRSFLRDMLGVSIKINSQDILSLAERMVNEVEKQNSAFDTMNAMPQFSDPKNPDIKFSRTAGMNDEFDPRNIAKETATRLYDWASSAPPGKLSWWHKTIGTMYNLAQRNPYFKPVFENTEKFINDVSFYAAKASELAPRLLPQLDSIRDITKSAIGAKDNDALSKPIFEGTLLWGRDLDGKAVLIEDWRKKTMAASQQDRLKMLKDAGRITPAQEANLAKLNAIQANRFINGIIDEEVSAGLVWTDNELKSKFDLSDEQIELYREFRSATDKSLDSLTRSDMLRRLGKNANDIEAQVMEVDTLREAVFVIEQHINDLIQASPKKEKALKETLKDIKDSQFRTNKLKDDGYAPLSRFGQYTVDVVDADGNREYFGMFESAYEARKMEAEMKALYDDPATHTVSRGTLSNEEFKLFAGVTPETAELFGEMLGLDATGDKAADEAFQEYLKRTKNNRSAMKRLMHRKGIKGYSEDVGRVLASFIYSNARHTSAALNMGNIDRAITDIPKGEGQLKDAAVKLAEYIKNPQEEAQLMRGWMFAQYLGGSIASAVVNITQPIAVSFPYLSQFGGAVKASSQLNKASGDWIKAFTSKSRSHFEPDLLAAIEKAEADGTLSPQEVHNLLKQASGKNPLSAGDGTKVGDARALAGNTLSRVSLAWGALFSGAEQINRRVTFVAAYRLAKEQGMDNPADFATKSIKETQFVYNKASRMNWGRGAVGGTLMTFKTYTVSYIELMHRLWNQGEKGSVERAQGRKATMIMLGVMFLLSGSGGLPFMEDAEDLIDGIGQIMGYNLSSKKARQDFLDAWFGEMIGDFLESGASTLPGSPTDVSGRLGLGNLIPGTGILKERTNNTRDVLEIAGPAGDFAGRIATGTRDIAKGVANLDATSLKKGALEFSPTAVRNAVKGIDMGASGIYKDTKGYKVTDVSPVDAAFKFAGFQPLKVSKIQEANYLGQTATSYYSLRASNIRALWAAGVVEGNQSKVADARAAVADWNAKNPDQKIVIKPTDIARRVREMKMEKSERVTKLAPKSMRAQMAQDFSQVRDGF